MNKILFTDTKGVIPDYFPKPAKAFVPDWYKNTKSYIGKKNVFINGTSTTIKKCVPVSDILTAGYIIPTWSDVWIKKEEDKTIIISNNETMKIDAHPKEQLLMYPNLKNREVAYKFLNPWSIKTPKGYSCFFVDPFHNPNPYFEILGGIVDTDTYYSPTNFPFFLKSDDFEGLIPAGTPIAQVIPFKRQTWKMDFGNRNDELNAMKIGAELKTSYFNSYLNRFWNKKEFS